MLRGLVTALRTLTILPVPGREAGQMSSALPWFPLVGCLLGLLLLASAHLAGLASGGWAEGTACIVLAFSIILTRGLHLEGLADAADGFAGGSTKEKMLEIMKDSSTGPFGAIAVVMVLIIKFCALTRLADSGMAAWWIIPASIAARTGMVELAVSLPYARPSGGTALPFVSGATGSHRAAALVFAAVLSSAACGPIGLAAVAAGWLISRLFRYWCLRRAGGVTGDLLGACNEIVETALLMLAAVLAPQLAAITGWEMITG